MKQIQRKSCAVCLFLGMAVGSHLQAQYSSQAFRIPATTLQQQSALGQLYEADGTYELDLPGRVYGLSVSGQVELKDSSNSLIRVTVEGIHGREFLVYEVFPLLAEGMSFAIEETGMESAVLEGIEAERLNIRIVNASFRLEAVQHIDEPVPSVQMSKQQTVDSQEDYIVSRLNENLQARNIPWVAGKTSVSEMTYEEKKAMFGGEVPNLGGFEYYVGGFFVMPGYEPEKVKSSSPYVAKWDWTNRNGESWVPGPGNQGTCGSCWAFSAVGMLEVYESLYYNQLIGQKLSEQELVSCMVCKLGPGKDNCDGGYIEDALAYMQDHGVVSHDCFPYQQALQPHPVVDCSAKCSNPSERVTISGYAEYSAANYTEDSLI